MSTYRSDSQLYSCDFCIEPLVGHEYKWYTLPLALVLFRPYRCGHCNLVHYRPLKPIGQIFSSRIDEDGDPRVRGADSNNGSKRRKKRRKKKRRAKSEV